MLKLTRRQQRLVQQRLIPFIPTHPTISHWQRTKLVQKSFGFTKNEGTPFSKSLGKMMDVSENVVYPIAPNGFADHYPYEKWLFHWEYTQHVQTNPYGKMHGWSMLVPAKFNFRSRLSEPDLGGEGFSPSMWHSEALQPGLKCWWLCSQIAPPETPRGPTPSTKDFKRNRTPRRCKLFQFAKEIR